MRSFLIFILFHTICIEISVNSILYSALLYCSLSTIIQNKWMTLTLCSKQIKMARDYHKSRIRNFFVVFHNVLDRFRIDDKQHKANLFRIERTTSQGRLIFSSCQYNVRWFLYSTHFGRKYISQHFILEYFLRIHLFTNVNGINCSK